MTNGDFYFIEENPTFKPFVLTDYKVPGWLREIQLLSNGEPGLPVSQPDPDPQFGDCNDLTWIKTNDVLDPRGILQQRSHDPPYFQLAPLMPPQTQAQYERHQLQLITSVLSLRTGASPFNLILDDLNQRATLLLREFIFRGLSRNLNIVLVSFETLQSHPSVNYIPGYEMTSADQLYTAIAQSLSGHKESLVIIDSLHEPLTLGIDIPTLFDLVVLQHASTLIGVYHRDLLPSSNNPTSAYQPTALEIIDFLATTILTCTSLSQTLAKKAARARSLPEPIFGLGHSADGIVEDMLSNSDDNRGIVIDAEFRRRSGRAETERYFLRSSQEPDYEPPGPGSVIGKLKKEFVVLLDRLPEYASSSSPAVIDKAGEGMENGNEMKASFELGLTEKQKKAREEVVLPYYDAQRRMGEAGEGGRILYDMGSEDDFDEEEDEI